MEYLHLYITADQHLEDTVISTISTAPLCDGENITNTQHSAELELPLAPVNITPQPVTRLPKLTLPTFSGNPLMWQTFWDSFSAAVYCSNTHTGIHKFNYLRAKLTDEAAKGIARFPLTNDNYIQAVTLLWERFGQTEKTVSAHMQDLLALPYLQTIWLAFIHFMTVWKATSEASQPLSNPRHSVVPYLIVPIILGKLPVEIRQSLARNHPTFEWTKRNYIEGCEGI